MFRQIADRVQATHQGPADTLRIWAPARHQHLPQAAARRGDRPGSSADPCAEAALHWQAIAGENDTVLLREHIEPLPETAPLPHCQTRLASLETAGKGESQAADRTANGTDAVATPAADAAENAFDCSCTCLGTCVSRDRDCRCRVGQHTLVRANQTRLSGAGCLLSKADGALGTAVAAALSAYRRQRALRTDPTRPSQALLAALSGVVRTGSAPRLRHQGSGAERAVRGEDMPRGPRASASGTCIRGDRTKAATRERTTTPPRRTMSQPAVAQQKVQPVRQQAARKKSR